MMRKAILLAALLVLAAAQFCMAASFQDPALKVEVQAPAGFEKIETLPPLPEVLGEVKTAFHHQEYEKTSGQLLIHHMMLPDGAAYEDFKAGLAGQVDEFLGGQAKIARQEDVTVGKLSGFLIEFEGPGNGKLPEAGGTIPHHVRWYLLKDGNGKLLGLVYHSRQDAWKELEPKFTASVKSFKSGE